MKGGGCGCSSGGLLGFPQAGGQRRRRLLGENSSMAMPSGVGGPSTGMEGMSMPSGVGGPALQTEMVSKMRQDLPPPPPPPPRRPEGTNMPQSNVSGALASIQAKLDSINAKLSSMPKSSGSPGLFGGGQNGGFLGFFENNSQPTVQPPMMASVGTNSVTPVNTGSMNTAPSAQNVVKMPAVTATNSGSADQRIRNLEQRLAQMEQSKGGFSFFGGGKRRKTRKTNKKRRSTRK